jgi:hypothetical protein
VDASAGQAVSALAAESTQLPSTELNASDVGGEVMHVVTVEVASGAVIALGARVSVPGEDLGIAQRHPASSALVIAAWRSECGLMWRGMPAAFAIRRTVR